ncbi:hypothetical protein BC835DRAFT_1422601 [Cytidiella melzeri]|nr:hypothetical protein BC835DRAFT_1422601 [Cytidiella melzeri]
MQPRPLPPYMSSPADACYVENLPDEIIVDIIALAIATELHVESKLNQATYPRCDNVSRLVFQEVVSHVCGRWRALALGMPSLWRYFDFLDGPPFDRSREWLWRSKDTPIDIVVNCTKVNIAERSTENPRPMPSCRRLGKIDPRDLVQIRHLILPHVSHWRSFTFHADDHHVLHHTLSALDSAGAAPRLESLFVSFNDEFFMSSPEDLYAGYVPFGGHAPQLRRLELVKVNIDWEQSTFLLGTNLERLKLVSHVENSRPSFPTFVRALRGSGSCNLHTLELRDSGPRGGDEESWPSGVVELPSVTRLVVDDMEASYLTALMRRLIFPKLKKLAVKFIVGECTSLVDVICDVVPLHSLVELHIQGVHSTDVFTVKRFWTAVQNIETLRISEDALQWMGIFINMWDQPDSFPRMHTLMTDGFHELSLARLIMFRKAPNPKRVGGNLGLVKFSMGRV